MRQVVLGVLLVLTMFLPTSCSRSGSEVWEDVKTGGHYMGRGFRALIGRDTSSRQVVNADEFVVTEEEYIPFNDDDLYQKLVRGDHEALQKIDAYTVIPQAHTVPGETGSRIPGIDGFRSPERTEVAHIFQHVHFDTNDYAVNGMENLGIIKSIADYIKRNPDVYMFVEGHCDERGTAAYNLALGSRRSNSVRALLIKEGVNPERIFTITYGKERPITVGSDSRSLQVNRRAQFKIYERGV